MKASELAAGGKGLALVSLIVGLATGLGHYAIIEYGVESQKQVGLWVAAATGLLSFSAAWLLMAEKNDLLRPIIPSLVIAGLIAAPSGWLASLGEAHSSNLHGAPAGFWFMLFGPLAAYLMFVLSKSVLQSGARPDYTAVFFHGLTAPLIAGGAWLFAGLALLLLYAWAALLKTFEVTFFMELFQKPWFILPFLGAIGGLSVALMRGQQSVLGALRFILLLLCRLLAPIMAVFSLTLIAVLILRGPEAIVEQDLLSTGGFGLGQSGGIMLILAFIGMLVFNGVYQNGEGAPPPAWLRIACDILLLTFPVYAGLALYAVFVRIDAFGLTPMRIIAFTMACLAFAYSLVGYAGLLTELRWKAQRWMPPVAPLNTFMAAAWIAVLLLVSSPLLNPWAMSAKSQEKLLLSQKISVEDFDFKFLRFELGPWGEAALKRLAAGTSHPESVSIAEKANAALTAESRYSFEPSVIEEAPPETEEMSQDIMDLPINPETDDGLEAESPADDAPAGEHEESPED